MAISGVGETPTPWQLGAMSDDLPLASEFPPATREEWLKLVRAALKGEEVSQVLVSRFAGKVPSDIDQLLELPGVGRKTANCVLVYAFDKPAIPVDVHVHRISNRIGLVDTKTPKQTELELSTLVDRRLWTKVNDTFVMYGQNICLPIKPNCKACDLKKMCRYYSTSSS